MQARQDAVVQALLAERSSGPSTPFEISTAQFDRARAVLAAKRAWVYERRAALEARRARPWWQRVWWGFVTTIRTFASRLLNQKA